MATRDELVAVAGERYRRSVRRERGRILDEFTALTGFHRKHAMRLLRSSARSDRNGARPERRIYGEAVRETLILLWETSDRVCGKRLRPLVPILIESMERAGHLQLAPEVRAGLLAMSAATIDRALAAMKGEAGQKKRRRSASSSAIRRSIPVRTFSDWNDPPPGFMERTWFRTAVPYLREVSRRRLRSRISPLDGRSARRSWSANRPCSSKC